MISYDNYLNRIQKVAKFKNFVHKFRFLIIGVFSLIIATTAGLLAAKGTVTTAMSLPAQIVFGDSYSPTATAFMSSVSYEYSLEGSGEWSSKQPVKAGKYLARTVTEKTFGKSYSDPVRFEILPREAEFTIGSDFVVYGEVPEECSVSNLVSGQKLVTADLRFEYESYTATRTQVDVIRSSVKITDGNGEDFTSCYDITFYGKELEITPRAITLQADSVEYTYADVAVSVENEVTEKSRAQLAYGDTITVQNAVYENGEPISAPKNKGNYQIRVDSFKIMKGDIDVTHHYNVTTLTAEFIINAREITITTGSAEKVYDSKSIQNTDFTSTGLIAGHEISALYGYPALMDAGEIYNENSFTISDGAGNDVTDNYNVKTVFGTLKITRRAITVKTGDAERVYDGNKLFNYGYEIINGSIVDGQNNYIINNDFGIYNVWESGAYNNRLILAIYDETGRDITESNYDITYVYGTLTLAPRDITIQTRDADKVYDGTSLYDATIVIADKMQLVTEHTVIGVNNVSITNAGSVSNLINFIIKDNFGYVVTDNYNITPVYGTLTVNKRPIVVTTSTSSFTFDGTYHSDNGYVTRYDGDEWTDGLVVGDRLIVSNLAQIRNVGDIENKFDVVDQSGNYKIRVTYGKLYVTARPIKVVTATDNKVYDGTPLINFSFRTHLSGNENEFGLLKEDEDKLILSGAPAQITNVGWIYNECKYTLLSDNYQIIEPIDFGILTVNKRAIEVQLLDVTVIYGKPIEYPSGAGNIAHLTSGTLVQGENIEVSVIFEGIKEGVLNAVGTYTIRADESKTKITAQNGDNTTSNYTVTYRSSTLTIELREITIKTQGNTKVYDGTPLYSVGHEATGLVAGHEIYTDNPFGITNVDESGYDRTIYRIRDTATKEDVTDNYNEIYYDYGYLEITARPLTVKTANAEKVYDGEPLENAGYTTYYYGDDRKAGLLNGDELEVLDIVNIVNVGEEKNYCSYAVPNSNYEIKEIVAGTLKVTQRWIIVNTGSAQKVYDKTPLTCEEYTTEYYMSRGDSNGNKAGLIGADILTLKGALKSITDVGEIYNANSYTASSNYYIYGTRQGKLTVTAREIVVVTGSAFKKYDGTPLTCTTYTTYYYGDKNEIGLIEGDGELTLIGEPASIINAGENENNCEYSVPSNNYVIADYEYGTLSIIPAPLNIVLNYISNIYYGDEVSYPYEKGNYKSADGLVNGEQLQVGFYYYNNVDKVIVDSPKNAGLYFVRFSIETTIIYDKDGNVIENGINNYTVTDRAGGIGVRKKSILITFESAQIVYGEEFEPEYTLDVDELPYGEEFKFIFSYFRSEDEGLDSPLHVGKYGININTKKSLVYAQDGSLIDNGMNNYSFGYQNTSSVTVTPRPITVQLYSIKRVQYGNEYSYPTQYDNYAGECDLSYDDTLTVFAIMPLPEELPIVGTYPIKADKEKTLINGVADTSDYIIEYLDGELEIIPREIIVTNLGAEKVYDGTALSCGAYTTRQAGYSYKPGLIGDDELTLIGELKSITNVGEIPNANRYTAGSNYHILVDSYIDESLVVTPRKIVIVSESGEWEYDGQYHDKPSFDENNSYHINEKGEREPALVLGHSFVIGDYAQIKDMGEIPNVFTDVKIFDGENDVTYNYEIDTETSTGTLKITPRPIIVTTKTFTKEYDGTPLFNFWAYDVRHALDESKVGLIEGDTLTCVESVQVTNVWEGIVENANKYYKRNYEIVSYEYGTLEITARKITVVIGDKEKEYSTAPYNFGDEVDNYENYLECNLADGEKLHIEVNFYTADGILIEKNTRTFRYSVGSYGMLLDTENCQIFKDGILSERGIENYDIECEDSTYTVIPHNVTITQNDIQAVYGGEIVYNGYKGGEDLQYFWGVQEKLTFTYHFENQDGETVSGNLRVGNYFICVDGDSVRVDGGSPSNYDFTFVDGNLYVAQRAVTVTLKSLTSIYGAGLPAYPTGDSNYESAITLAYDDTLEVFVRILAGERPNAGTYNIVIDEEKSPLVNGSDDTSDYAFEFVDGELTVESRTIYFGIIASQNDLIYGEIYQYPVGIGNYTGTPDLAYGEKLEIVISFYLNGIEVPTPKNVGIYSDQLTGLLIYDSDGKLIENGRDNYVYGVIGRVGLRILPADLTVTINDGEYIYGNQAPEITYSTEGLEFGELLTLDVRYKQDGRFVTPKDAGEYEICSDESLVRIDGSADGAKNYTISFVNATLAIYQRHIKVKTATSVHVYDGKPYSDGTIYSYFSDDEEIDGFVSGDLPKIIWETVPTVTNVKDGEVENRFDFNVSNNYIIDDISYGTISIAARSLTVQLNSYSIIYGEEFDYPEEVGNYAYADDLVEGETLQIFAYLVAEQTIPDVGTYEIAVDESRTLGENDYSNYSIEFISGWLTINVRRIVIASASATWVYDGKEHSAPSEDPDQCYYINADGKKVQPALVDGHEFRASEYPKIKNVGTILNTCYSGVIYDSDGNPVKDGNYEIDIENSGTLTVTPIKITVTTGSAEKEYDGYELSSDYAELTEGTLADNQRFELYYIHTITNVSETYDNNNLSTIRIYDENGENVTDNYEITYTEGTLTVTPRQIVVITADGEWVYDGISHSKATDYTTYHFGEPEEDGLLNGDTLSVVGSASIKDVGSIDNDCTYRVSTNYQIERVEAGKLTVTERHITVETLSKTKIYDREPLFETRYRTYLTADSTKVGLVGGDSLTLDESSIVYIIEVGTIQNTLVFTVDGNNYVIDDYVYGDLEVTRRPLLIVTADDSKIYDGEPLENPNCTVTLYVYGEQTAGLLEGDSLKVISQASLTEVGSIENVCKYDVPNDNYNIVAIRFGTLTVTKATLEVVLYDVESVDYGERLFYPAGEGNYDSVKGLIGDQKLEIAVYYTDKDGEIVNPRNAGEYYVCIDLENSKISGTENGIGNYEVVYTVKTATIYKLTLKIVLENVEYSYDGTARGYNQAAYTIEEGKTVYGEFLNIFVKYFNAQGELLGGEPKDAGNYTVVLDKENCLVNNGWINANVNYNLICEEQYGYVITPAKFTVNLADVELVYNGREFSYSPLNGFEVDGLFGSDELECTVTYYLNGVSVTPKNVGTYKVEFDAENIEFKHGNPSNYEFDDTEGNYTSTLTITPRPIRVTVNDREIEYTVAVDPADESYEAVYWYAGTVLSGMAFVGDDEENASATYYYDGTTSVPAGLGEYSVTVEFLGEVMSNYEVTVVAGKLTIVGRKVLVTPVYTGGDIEYNGYAINVDGLINDNKLGFTHVHNIYGAAADDMFGFAEEDLKGLTVTYEFREANSGKLYTRENAPKNAGIYYVTVKITGYNPAEYKVEYEENAKIVLVITPKTLYITSISDVEKVYDKHAPETPEIVYSGLLAVDEGKVVTAYLDEDDSEITAYNVGTYVIGAKVYDESGAENYIIEYAPSARGTLTITPVTLYIKPASKQPEYYNGKDIELSGSDYEFVDAEHSGLVAGDKIIITPSTKLDPSKIYVTVSIISASVFDEKTGTNMTGNYNLYYSYDRNVMGSAYNSSDFKGSLEYLVRTIHYNQIVPEAPDGQQKGWFLYDGTTKTVEGDRLFEILYIDGDNGFSDYRIEVSSSTIGPQAGQYYNWLKLAVYDTKSNRDISRVYDFKLENAEDSYVTIGKIGITLTIKSGLSSDMLENGDEVFYTSSIDGRRALKEDWYTVENVIPGHTCEVIAIKSSGVWNFAVVIYQPKENGSLTDKSDCYNLKVVKDETFNVVCKIVECHSLTTIPSDITLTLKASYENIAAGVGFEMTFDNRQALNASQYEIAGLLAGHTSEVVVLRSNGVLTLAVLVFEPKYTGGTISGRSDRSYFYNLIYILPEDFSGEVDIVLTASLMEVKQDVTITITADLQDIKDGAGLVKTFDGRWALESSLYTVQGLLEGHDIQIIAIMSGGNVTFAVLIFEGKYTNGELSGRSDKSYLYNLFETTAPQGAEVKLVSSLNEILTDITITLSDSVTAENLAAGLAGSVVTKSDVDGRLVLSAEMFTIENNFGESPLASGHKVEIIVDKADDGSFNLYVIVYQLSSAGKRSDKSYLYTLNCSSTAENINVIYKSLPLGNEGLN